MKKASKIILGSVLVVTAAGTLKVFAGSGEGCHFRGHGGPFASGMIMGRMTERVSSELDLTATQKGNLDALVKEITAIRSEAISHRDERKAELLSLLDSPTLDQARVLNLVTEKAQKVETVAPEIIAAIAAFTDSLTPEQKTHLHERIDQGFGHGIRPF